MADSFGAGDDDPIPDLARLPQEQWLDALRPLSRSERTRALNRLQTMEQVSFAYSLIGQLMVEGNIASQRAIAAPTPRLPVGDPPPHGPRRQVNFRLGAGEHGRLLEAARLFGMRPNMLARLLTVRGVDRALADARRDR